MPLVTNHVEQSKRQPAQFFTLHHVTWELYELLVRDAEGQNVRITFDNGTLVLMWPLPIHGKLKRLLGALIEGTAVELNIDMAMFGSTTWKRKDLSKGLEADESYYIQNEARVRALKEFDLTRDPAPDLAVEVDISRNPLDRLSIYAQLRVNEIWRHDGQRVHFLKLGPAGAYEPVTSSEAFPMLTPDVIDRHLALIGTVSDTEIRRRFQDWLLEHTPR